MKYEIKQNVSPQGVAYLFITALEGGSNYWLESFSAPQDVKEASTWAALTELRVEWTDAEDEDADGVRVIDKTDIERGLAGMMGGYGVAYDSADQAIDHDADSADVLLQLVLFGEVIYG